MIEKLKSKYKENQTLRIINSENEEENRELY